MSLPSELLGSSDIVGKLVLAVRKIMTEEMVPKMDSILKIVEEHKAAMASIEQEQKLARTRIDQLEYRLKQLVETWISKENERILEDPVPTPEPKNMELRFSNKISQRILTGDEIKAEDNTCVEVFLLDSSTGNIVDVGPVASANVEIVALGHGTGDWTGDEFDEKIVRVEGKQPVLTVNKCKLQEGKVVLEKLKFRNHAAELVKPSEFRLGARIAGKFDGITIKEAKTESFVVEIYRKKYSQKKEIPHLEDNIWVLKNIQRRGAIDVRLQAKGIDSVEKFLIQLLKNPEELKNIAGLAGNNWKATVHHARKCKSTRMYCYTNSQETLRVVFDIFGKLQGLHSEGRYTDTNMLSKNKKVDADKLLLSAFEHWGDVTPFVDPDSRQQHLEAVKTSFNLSNSRIPGQYPGLNPGTGNSEMVDGSNNIEVPEPLLNQGIPVSDKNSLARESFGIYGFGVNNQCFSTTFTDSDIGYLVYGARRTDGTGSVLAESEAVVPGGEPPRKLGMLFFCISRWFLKRKMLNSEANAARKKQKICSRNTGHPFSNPNGGACEMIDGSNNIEFPNPLFDQEIINSDMTSFSYYDAFSTHDVEFNDGIPSALGRCSSFDLGTLFPDFDIGSVAYQARNDGNGSVSAGSEAVVPGCEPPRKWKTLVFCVSRLLLIKKTLNSEANTARKKRKIHQLY